MPSKQSQSYFVVGARLPLKAFCVIACFVLFFFAAFAPAQQNPQYGDCAVTTVGSPANGPDPMTGVYGGQLNGFLPYPSDYVLYNNISSAAIDPNSAALISDLNSVSSNKIKVLFGSSPYDSGIPYYVTDSSIYPHKTMPIISTNSGSPDQSEVMVIPYPNNDAMPIESDTTDCGIWPNDDTNDQHSLLLDRNGCWLYEIWVTSRCPGSDLNMYYDGASVTLFDATNFSAGPWGFTSADASGMSVYTNTLKYDEAASGTIRHPIRFTVPTSAGSSAFILPASHGASSSTLANKLPEGALLRLNPARTPTINTSGMSTIDATVIIPAIIAGLQNYGMIMADNGSNMYLIGDIDSRWNDSDLSALTAIVASDFDVIQMVPEYPSYMTEHTATTLYPETEPTITSFSASAQSLSTVTVAGADVPPAQTPGTFTVPNSTTPVTFEICASGTNYNETFAAETAQPFAYIDNAGPVRLGSDGCGSITVTPTVTQEYTAYVLNADSNFANSGLPNLATINVVVTGAPTTPAQVVFVPPPTIINGQKIGNGSGYVYAADSVKVTPITSTWAPLNTNDNVWNEPNAVYFYTTATGTSNTFPVVNTTSPLPTETGGVAGTSTTMLSTNVLSGASGVSITVTKANTGATYGYEVVCAIATVPAIGSSYGNSNPSPSSCGTYVFTNASTSFANAPIILPPSGTYNTPQLISMAAPVPAYSASSFNAIFYTTNGTTPTTATGAAFSNPPALPTLIYSQGQASTCYGGNTAYGATPSCTPTPVYATNGMTIEAIAATKTVASTVTTNTYTITAATPTYSPIAGTYATSQEVTISSASPGATIYYTTDGSAPTTGSAEYSSAVTVSAVETLSAIATCTGCGNSAVGTAAYTTSVSTPTFSPVAGSYGTAQTVTIGDTFPSSTIYYTTDGSTPTTSSPVYSTPITVSSTETLSALGTAAGISNSAVGSAVYTIGGTAATPTFSPVAGSYAGTQAVTISDASNGASIYYTTNGTAPTTSSTSYSSPITVSSTQTLEVIASGGGYTTSAVATATYTIAAATPTFSPVAGIYTAIQTVTISDSTPGSKIYYTTNGTIPTTSSPVYSTPITVSATGTLEAIATLAGDANSAVGSAIYTIVAATPTFSPVAGSYTTVQSITVSDTTPGVTIYYTTDGSTPTTSSAVYPGSPIILGTNATTTLSAIAAGGGFSPSGVISGTYSLSGLTGSANIPSFSPGSGSYTGTQTVTVTDASAGVSIFYTLTPGTTGVAPTTFSSNNTTGFTISITQSSVLEAFAEGGKYPAGSTKIGTYTIAAVVPTFSPAAGSYSSIQTVTMSTTTPGATIYYTTNGSTPTSSSTTYSVPISVSATQTLKAIAEGTNLNNSTVGSAAYTITLSTAATPTFSPVAGSYGSAQSVSISDTTPGATIYYTTNGTTPTTNSPAYSGAIAVSANETLEALAVAYNYLNSVTGSAAYTIAAATPTFSLAAGSYGSAQPVSISDTTVGAVIYYTTNGSAPTTGSAVYSAAITVSGSETLNAIAVASGYGVSATGTAVYTTPPYTPVFSLAGGTYYSSQTVTISDATAGATIYYTTNATTPTTNSTPYTAPLSITATEAIEAIAASSGAPASSVTSAIYTIATPAALTVPTPDTTTPLSGTSVTFAWTSGNTATHFEFYVGTSVGSSNLYNSGNVTATTETVSGLPSNGETLYVRLYWLLNGSWKNADYTYVASGAPTQAVLTTPAPNTSTPLSGTSVAFAWNPGNLATHFQFYVGTTGAGSSNLYNSGNVTATTETVSGLPGNGETVNARLYSLINGVWEYTDYTYKANGAPIAAALTTPTPNTLTPLTGTSVAFSWTPGNIATHFEFYVGTTGVGSSNLYNSGNVTVTTESVSNLPDNDSTVYVRLYSLINGAWQSTDYTYVSAGTATQAVLTTPPPNTSTPLSGTSVTFSWTPGNSATHFEFYVGSTGAGSSNLYNSGNVTATSATVSDLPSNGETLNMRLYSLINGAWKYTDYTYVANGAPVAAALTTPTPNTLTPLTGTSVAFSWTPGNTATHFEFYVGSTGVGSSNLYNSGNVTVTTETVSNLPSNGETVYVRLYSLINGAWQYTDYTYVSAGAATQAALTAPPLNSQFTSTTVTFTWTPGNTATHFMLYVGTSVGSNNLYNSGNVTVTSETVNGLPSNGEKIYARLYSLINGAWKYADYTYTAF